MVIANLDPVLERLSGRHLPGCLIWLAVEVMDADLCTCPPPKPTIADDIAHDLVADLPHNASAVRARLAETARHDPEMADGLADGLLRQVLARIACGVTPPDRAAGLARAALVAVGDNRGWVA